VRTTTRKRERDNGVSIRIHHWSSKALQTPTETGLRPVFLLQYTVNHARRNCEIEVACLPSQESRRIELWKSWLFGSSGVGQPTRLRFPLAGTNITWCSCPWFASNQYDKLWHETTLTLSGKPLREEFVFKQFFIYHELQFENREPTSPLLHHQLANARSESQISEMWSWYRDLSYIVRLTNQQWLPCFLCGLVSASPSTVNLRAKSTRDNWTCLRRPGADLWCMVLLLMDWASPSWLGNLKMHTNFVNSQRTC